LPDHFTRLVFIGLWNIADDEGRGYADARLIRAGLFPLDPVMDVAQVELAMVSLEAARLIERYEASGRYYYAVTSWNEHQRINRPSPSRLPAPPLNGSAQVSLTDYSLSDPGALTAGSRKLEVGSRKHQSAAKPRPRNVLVDTLAEIEGSNPSELTRPQVRALGVAVAEIREATPDVSPDEIRRRAANYRAIHPTWELTGPALAKHWGGCGSKGRKAGPESRPL